MVKYCSRDCQIAHRKQHKKACKKRAAELHEDALFKQHPPQKDCPICFLTLPIDMSESAFFSCCGKHICMGCIRAMVEREGVDGLCPFCRTPCVKSNEEEVERIKKLVEKGNADAFHTFARYYAGGTNGMPQNMSKANELYLQVGELC